MVVMSIEMYEQQQSQLDLYAKLAEAESEVATGSESVEFFEFAKKLRDDANGKL